MRDRMLSKELVLVGGGHAHIQVLHALRSSNIKITLISDVPFAPYSGMLPGHLAGLFNEHEMVFNLKNICSRFGYRFIEQAVTSIDSVNHNLTLFDGSKISFDVCCLNVGILPQTIPSDSQFPNVIYVKPISNFLAKWRVAVRGLATEGKVLVVGGGAAAFELAIACGIRFPHRVSLITGEQGLTLPERAASPARLALEKLGVELIEGKKVERIEEGKLLIADAVTHFALALIAITARPSEIIQRSVLPKADNGHVLIDDFLRVEGSTVVFAAGDCAHFGSKPLPKSGVYAVRQGPILAHNLLSTLTNSRDLQRFVPQEKVLSILISGFDEAIFCWRGIALRSHWAAKVKRWIDHRFMRTWA